MTERARDTAPLGLPGTLAGRYELGDLLGGGGMGLVHHAHDAVLDRDVAVKLLADNLAMDPEARERFDREARAAARLTHPHVVRVYDVGEENGRPYFVMEHVPGGSLAVILREGGPLPASDVVEVARDVLKGLAAAHDAGLLHRDLKPGNLLRDAKGHVKVTDFGVAEAREVPHLTRTGVVLGTLPYLAPERLTGEAASEATDIYALGATLLELLTGEAPDPRPDEDGAPRHGPGNMDTVPPLLATFIHRCMAKDPAQRPQSAREALALLEPRPDSAHGGQTQILNLAETATVAQARMATRPRAAETGTGPSGALAEVAESVSRGEPTRRVTEPDLLEQDPSATSSGTGSSQGNRRQQLVLAAIAVVVIVLLIALGSTQGGGEATPETGTATDPATPATEEPAPAATLTAVPRDQDPAQQLRNTADWIRQRAEQAG